MGLGRGAEPARAQGTRHVLDLAGRMRRCGAFVHVSSAYANGHLPRGRLVRERLYPPPGAGARLPAALSGVGAPAGWSRVVPRERMLPLMCRAQPCTLARQCGKPAPQW